MTNGQRKVLAEAFASLANIVAGAMIFGQFIAGQRIDFGIVTLGAFFAVVFYITAYIFAKKINN